MGSSRYSQRRHGEVCNYRHISMMYLECINPFLLGQHSASTGKPVWGLDRTPWAILSPTSKVSYSVIHSSSWISSTEWIRKKPRWARRPYKQYLYRLLGNCCDIDSFNVYWLNSRGVSIVFLGKGPVQIKWKANACCNYDKINGSNFIRKQHIHVLTTKYVLIHMKLIIERYQLIIVTLIHTFLAAAIFH